MPESTMKTCSITGAQSLIGGVCRVTLEYDGRTVLDHSADVTPGGLARVMHYLEPGFARPSRRNRRIKRKET